MEARRRAAGWPRATPRASGERPPPVAVRVAVTGARGRLGRALLAALRASPVVAAEAGEAVGAAGALPSLGELAAETALEVVGWSRPHYDLDAPRSVERLLDRDRPEVVVHAAAWTDVDGCARQPDLAMARNGEAVEVLARACAARGVHLILVSTNEVFDGLRSDGRGYAVDDPPNPINPYGASKLAGELAALAAFGCHPPWQGSRGPGGAEGEAASSLARHPQLLIVRTAWLFGPPGNDFPSKILAAARAAAAEGRPLRVVADEVGSPTYSVDLARAIAGLVTTVGARAAYVPGDALPFHRSIWHLVNAGRASRAEWARETLRLAGLDVPVVDISADEWPRASTPPRWAVLAPGILLPGLALRPWPIALAEYLRGEGGAPGGSGADDLDG